MKTLLVSGALHVKQSHQFFFINLVKNVWYTLQKTWTLLSSITSPILRSLTSPFLRSLNMHPLKTMVLLLMFCCPRLLSMSVMPSKTYKVFTLVKNLIAKMLHFRQITFQPAHNIPGIFGKCSLSLAMFGRSRKHL